MRKVQSNIDLNLRAEFPPPSFEQWKAAVVDTLKGAEFDKAMKTKTDEGITLEPIYRKEDTAELPFLRNIPGTSPYLRGSDPHRFLAEGWLIAQSHGEADPAALNAEILRELQLGVTAVNLRLEHHDSVSGVNISSLEDLRAILNGVDLHAAPLFMQLDVCESGILDWIEQYAAEKGLDLANLDAGIGFDPTGEFARKGYLEEPLDALWKKLLESVHWNLAQAPRNRLLSIDATVYGAAGATSVQELGFALSTAIGYIQGLQQSGLEIDSIAPLFQITLSLGSNFFLEIAKIRAFRLLWAEMIRAFGGSEKAQKIWIHGKTAGFNKSSYDAYVNVLRTSTEGFAGVIGGVDSLEIGCFDELTAPESDFSRRISRNQQIILKEEAHFGKVIDPAGGCYYIERLTGELAGKAWSLMQEIESAGGMIRSLRAGKIHELVASVARNRIDAVHKRKSVFVGVNMFANPDEKTLGKPAQQQDKQIAKAVELEQGALPKLRAVQELEQLRRQIEASGKNTKILLLNMGELAEYKARADFSLGFFQTAGFEVLNPTGFASVDAAAQAARDSGAAAFCICSTDENYQSLVPEIGKLLKGKTLILAGYPADMVEACKQAGVNIFIHMRADLHATLRELANLMGVTA